MEQIKPKVVGFKLLHASMSQSYFNWSLKEISELHKNKTNKAFIHENGKFRIRPVYKKDIK